MNLIQKLDPVWALRLGLGLMFLYSGSSLFYTPEQWYGFAPQWFSDAISNVISIDVYLRIQGIGEFLIGLLMLAWFSGTIGVRVASVLATLEMAGILFFTGVDLITFRDIGLLGAVVALLILSFKEVSVNFTHS